MGDFSNGLGGPNNINPPKFYGKPPIGPAGTPGSIESTPFTTSGAPSSVNDLVSISNGFGVPNTRPQFLNFDQIANTPVEHFIAQSPVFRTLANAPEINEHTLEISHAIESEGIPMSPGVKQFIVRQISSNPNQK
jgi:hypothetical protein